MTKGRAVPTRPVRLRAPHRPPRTLGAEEVTALLGACDHVRDRFVLAVLSETGMRIGQALGLRHADVITRERGLRIVPRDDNANGARAKTRSEHDLPISTPLARLYSLTRH